MQIITGLTETKVRQVAAGAEHSAIVTGKKSPTLLLAQHIQVFVTQILFDCPDDGSVMAWGWGEHGQLGLGDTNDQIAPQVVNLGHKLAEKCAILSVYCGSGFSFVLRTFENLGASQTRF